MARILVTGAGGMLGSDVVPFLKEAGIEVVCSEFSPKDGNAVALDISNRADVLRVVEEVQPEWIVNCAAYTQVDKAEEEKETAFSVNALGPENLSLGAQKVSARLLHVSTDYVFSDVEKRPLAEDIPRSPCGVYGESKAEGEKRVQEILGDKGLIVRTSWLHGVHGPNFVSTILRIASEREEIKVVDDQVGSPTWTRWLAKVLSQLIQKDAHGVFHASSRGNISWFEFAKEIVRCSGKRAKVLPQTTAELSRPAPRPSYSTFDVSKLERLLGEPCISWKEGLKEHLQAIGELKNV